MSRRASLPGADELFRRTSGSPPKETRRSGDESLSRLDDKSPPPAKLQGDARSPKHDEKITFYCTGGDLLRLEQVRLTLRAEHGISADRGRIVRAALDYVLDDFSARGEGSILHRQLGGGVDP